MTKHYLKFILFLCFPVSVVFSQAQKPYGEFSSPQTQKTEKELLKAARKEFDFGNYGLASAKYLELLKIDSTNPMYNFEQAQSLYNNFHQTQSIRFYENAIRYSKDTLGEAYYFLGSAYHLNSQFDNAIGSYKRYLSILNYHGTDMMEEEEQALKDEVTRKMEMCENGKKIYASPATEKFTFKGKPRPFKIETAGKEVNSDFDDYGVVLSASDSMMYFTSRREGTTGGRVDWDDKFFEDIYLSVLGKTGWGASAQMGEPINTKKHEAIISITPDGKTLYFYRGVKQGTFYFSNQQNGVWSKPEVLEASNDLNSDSWETSFFGFSIAGNELYVVSDREGGIGGRDIYMAKKNADGSWGKLNNLGAPINTKYDEDAPFITADGRIMYFSSKGHNSMGGFDIFTSRRDADKWGAPENVGRPFNTPGEDIYFILANKSDRAYYASSSLAQDGSKDLDIYMVDFCDEAEEVLLAGVSKGIMNGSVSVVEKESGQKAGDFSIENGRFSTRLKHGKNYRFSFSVRQGSDPVSADISVPRMCKVHDIYQELDLNASTLTVRNAFFDIKNDAGATSYSDYIAKLDKASQPLYSEFTLPVSEVLVTNTVVVSTPTVVVSTPTLTVSTPTVVVASTNTVTTTVETPEATTISVNNVLFDYDRSTINSEYIAELDKVAKFLKGTKNAKIEVAGFTDSKGSDEYNQALSKRRADAVASYLASKGISRSRIQTVGNGESRPIAANENPDGSDNPDGRAKNRRTEITVIR